MDNNNLPLPNGHEGARKRARLVKPAAAHAFITRKLRGREGKLRHAIVKKILAIRKKRALSSSERDDHRDPPHADADTSSIVAHSAIPASADVASMATSSEADAHAHAHTHTESANATAPPADFIDYKDSENEHVAKAVKNGERFSKIAHLRHQLGPLGQKDFAYEFWRSMARLKFEYYELGHCLKEDPTQEGILGEDTKQWAAVMNDPHRKYTPCNIDGVYKGMSFYRIHEEQRQLYNMILQCFPPLLAIGGMSAIFLLVTDSLPEKERTAYGAWQALTRYYIGNNSTHLKDLDADFHNLRWHDDENFASLEARFGSFLSQLQMHKCEKDETTRRNVLMNAILQSKRTDMRGKLVCEAIKSTSDMATMINSPYRAWLEHVRSKAQEIEQEIATTAGGHGSAASSGHKRRYADTQGGSQEQYPRDVNAVTTFGAQQQQHAYGSSMANPHRPGNYRPACRDWMKGNCQRGNACRFAHNAQGTHTQNSNSNSNSRSQSHGNNYSANGRRAPPVCWSFSRNGSCRFGDSCRFSHGSAQAAARTAPASSLASLATQFRAMANHVEQALGAPAAAEALTLSQLQDSAYYANDRTANGQH